MTITIENEASKELPFDYKALIERVVMGCMDYEKCPYEAEVNVLLTNNEEIHKINKEYRGIDRPTDVLSFPMVDYDKPANFDPNKKYPTLLFCEGGPQNASEDYFNFETGELVLGDIIISVDKVYEQAESYGHSLERELGFLVAHSMLHLFGYDHMEEEEREQMEARQREILNGLSILR